MDKKLLFSLASIPVAMVVAPAIADANAEIYTYENGISPSKPVVLPDGTVYFEDAAIDPSDSSNVGYAYNIVKLQNDQVVKELKLEKGVNYLTTYNNEAYGIFLNNKTGEITIYDSNLTVLNTLQTDVIGSVVTFAQHGQYVSVIANSYDTTVVGDWREIEHIEIVDLKTAELAPDVKAPLASAKNEWKTHNSNSTQYITVQDALGREQIAIPMFGKEYNINSNVYFANGNILFIGSRYGELEENIVTMDLEGNILNEQVIPKKGGVTHKLLGDVIRLQIISPINGDYDRTEVTIVDYDLKTRSFKEDEKIELEEDWSMYEIDDKFAVKTFMKEYPMTLITTHSGEPVYYKQDASVYWVAGEHYVFTGTDNENFETTYDLINIENGYAVAHDVTHNTKLLYATDEKVVYATGYNDDAKIVVTDAIGKPLPTGDVVAADKTWTIHLSQQVDSYTLDGVYVRNKRYEKVPVEVRAEGKKIIIKAPDGGYEQGENYVLHIQNTVKSKVGQSVMKRHHKAFTIQ